MQQFSKISSEKIGYAQVFIAAIIWGSYGLFVRGLPYPAELLVFLRFFFGFLSLMFFAGIMRKLYLSDVLSCWRGLLLAGVFCGLGWYAYTFSLTYTKVANAAFLLYTSPCFVVALAPILLKEEISKRAMMALLICLAGTISIVKGNGFSLGGSSWLGDTIALTSGLFYGLTVLAVKRLPAKLIGLTGNLYLSLIVCIISFPIVINYFQLIQLEHLLLLVTMGVIHQGLANSLYYAGLGRIKAHQASILSYFDPLFAVVFAFIFLNEGLTLYSLLGGVLIFVGGIMVLKNGSEYE